MTMAKFVVRVHMERINGTVERVPMSFATEAEAEAFIGPALLADCVLAVERTWLPADTASVPAVEDADGP